MNRKSMNGPVHQKRGNPRFVVVKETQYHEVFAVEEILIVGLVTEITPCVKNLSKQNSFRINVLKQE